MQPPVWDTLKLERGMWPDVPPRAAKNFVRSGNWVRWRSTMEPIGGWQKASLDALTGTPRKVFEFQDNSGYTYDITATHKHVFAMFDGEQYVITPIEEYAALSAAIATTSGDATYTVTKTAHGYVTGMFVRFPSAPTISGQTLNATFYEITKIDANTFSFEAGGNANATASGLGGNYLDMDVFLRPGLEFSLVGAGFGTGAYDVGLYGGTLASSYKARTWTFGALGELLIGCPRGGKQYEWGPAVSTTDLAERVTNGTFTGSASSWTLGAGWAYGSNAISATGSTASATQSITLPSGRWVRIRVTCTAYTGGTLQVKLGSTSVGSAISAVGRYTFEVFNTTSSAQNIELDAVTALTATFDDVTVKVMDTMAWQTAAPSSSGGIIVLPSGQVLAYATIDPSTSAVDPLLVRTSAIDDTSNWTTAFSNAARSFYLYGGRVILGGCLGANGQVFLLTNASLWEGRYVGPPTYLDFQQRGVDCGMLGPKACCFHNSRLYWASTGKRFMVFDGATVSPIFCPGEDAVFDNMAWVQGDLLEAWSHPYDEVWFCYADARDGNEVSRYAALMQPGQEARWTFGQLPAGRTAFHPQGAAGYPLMASADGHLYYHEVGDTSDGGNDVTWSARATAIEIGNGNTLAEVQGFIADFSDQNGPVTLNFYGYEANHNSVPIESGDISVLASSTYLLSFFTIGRQIDIEFSGAYHVKIGNGCQMLIHDTGNQF